MLMIVGELGSIDFDAKRVELRNVGINGPIEDVQYAMLPVSELEHSIVSMKDLGERCGCPPGAEPAEWIVERVHLAARLEEKANG